MSVLGKEAILRAISDGTITITPFREELVGPASVDLTLASTFRVFRKVHEVITVQSDTDYRNHTDKIEVEEGSRMLIMPGETLPMNDAGDIREALEHEVELVIDGGPCEWQPTTVVDLMSGVPRVLRFGLGDVSSFS